MYDFYISNYLNDSGSIVGSETLLYSVPISDAMKNRSFIDPTIKTEMGKAGSMDFSMYSNHEYVKRFQQMKTLIRAVYDGTTIFRGRTLTIDDSPFTGERKIHMEGDLAFLMDSQQEGVKKEDRQEVSINQYLQTVITNHNSQMITNGESYKTFVLGQVPGQYSVPAAQQIVVASNDKFGNDSWRSTMDTLNDLTKKYGGYFRTRYEGGVCYLDWLQFYFNNAINSTQPIQVSSNLIEISSTTEVNNLFTVLIPIGSNKGDSLYVEGYTPSGSAKRTSKGITIPELVSFCSASDLNKGYHSISDYQNAIQQYGTIYKVQQFSNATTQAELWTYAIDWMKNNYIGGIRNFTISAMDMHHTDSSKQKYLTGDYVSVICTDYSSAATKNLTILSAQYKPHSPEKNSYDIGIPSDLISKEYGSSKKNSGGSSSGGGGNKSNIDDDRWSEYLQSMREYSQKAWDFIVSKRYNGDVYDQLYKDNPKKAERALIFTHATLTEGLAASDSRPTSGIHKKRFLKGVIDGMDARIDLAGPIDKQASDLTAEQVQWINQSNRAITISGLTQEIGLRSTLKTLTPDDYKKPTNTLLDLKIKDGKKSVIELFPPSKADNSAVNTVAELIGDIGGKGFFGRDGSNNWLTQINNIVTYKDMDGGTHTDPGFITAQDFNIPTVDSFKVKIAIVDLLIATKIEAEEILADLTYLRKLSSDSIQAGTSVRTAKLFASEVKSGSVYASDYQLMNDDGGAAGSLLSCFNGGYLTSSFDSSTGVWTVTMVLTRIGGGEPLVSSCYTT